MIIAVEYELNSFIPLFCARITFHCRYLWLIFHYNITVYNENCSKTVAIYCNYNILNKITEALLSNNVLNAIFDPLLTMFMSLIHILATEYTYSDKSCVTRIKSPEQLGSGLPSWYFPVGGIPLRYVRITSYQMLVCFEPITLSGQ